MDDAYREGVERAKTRHDERVVRTKERLEALVGYAHKLDEVPAPAAKEKARVRAEKYRVWDGKPVVTRDAE